MKKSKYVLLYFLAFIVGGGALFCIGCQKVSSQERLPEPTPVITRKVYNISFPQKVYALGLVKDEKIVKQAFKTSGKLVELFVKEGETVKKGEIIAKIETKDLEFAVQGAQADYESAKAWLKKAKKAFDFALKTEQEGKILYEKGALSSKDYEKMTLQKSMTKADYEAAKEKVNQALVGLKQRKDFLENTTLKSPFDGQVVSVFAQVGELVASGHPVIVISNGKPTIHASISQNDLEKVKKGLPAKFSTKNKQVIGKIQSVNKIPDKITRTYGANIELEKVDFPIGTVGDVSIEIGTIKGITVPIESVVHKEKDFVYVVVEGRAQQKEVLLGSMEEKEIFVQGLNEGDILVVQGAKHLKHGELVHIQN